MLVLSRKRSESIHIGDDVTVTIVDIRGDAVRLGIDAPREMGIHRSEVWVRIQEEQAAVRHDAKSIGCAVKLGGNHA